MIDIFVFICIIIISEEYLKNLTKSTKTFEEKISILIFFISSHDMLVSMT